ncbi:Threonylcarbamoyl-AMP synthase [hydrothermal vent metagenome]|uniref:L-threonylcarbamoyladenylate synthase n=1 Tax=hydrothermal vent metagenome TaxID=652676 RepID=A0A3B0XF44_9ZZZZ
MYFIKQAARIIQNGGIISYPTESVFGLGCDPLSEIAVKRILKLKQRSVDKGLIIIAGTLQQLIPYIKLCESEKEIILKEKSATTWLMKKSELTPHWVSGAHKKVAVRISQHPLVINLCAELNQPIISTSANPAGATPALTSQQSETYFSTKVDYYLQDNTPLSGRPTPIKDIETGQIFRHGHSE